MSTNIDYFNVRDDGSLYIEGDYTSDNYSYCGCGCSDNVCTESHYITYEFNSEKARDIYDKLKAVFEPQRSVSGKGNRGPESMPQ